MSILLFRVIDLETGGMAPPSSVIEIGWTDVYFDPETKRTEVGADTFSRLFAPRETLTPDNIAVHHLTPKLLAGRPHCTDDDLRRVATSDKPFALVAANMDFEAKWFAPEIVGERRLICTVKAAARIHPDAPSHSNQAMRYQLGLDDLPDARAMPPHRAGPDSFVTAHILAKFLETTSVRDLVAWTKLPRLLPRCPMGKHRGAKWADVPRDYLDWILRQADMDADVKYAAQSEIDRREDPEGAAA